MFRTSIALFLTTFLLATPVAAAGQSSLATAATDAAASVAVSSAGATVAPPVHTLLRPNARPSVLPSMYVGLAALQGYDAYSTLKALNQGAVEANPLMGGVAGHPAALIAVKSAATFASIYASERLWRDHHHKAAIVLMAVTTGAMAMVAAHNASVIRVQR